MDETAIRAALAPFNLGKMLDSVQLQDGIARITLTSDRATAEKLKPLRENIEKAILALPGIARALVIFTLHRAEPAKAATSALAGIKSIIAVASGKGGVGKSTVTANLAVALAQRGLKIGILDADIYGPSMPRMLGASSKPGVHEGRIIPDERWSVKCMSIGLLVEEETAMVWRGPMVASALTQMLEQVEWGALDVLVIDMPPGTGDVQMTLAQKAALAGAVIVSTPQDIALIDARRAAKMFGQVGVPILGVIENMAYFCCPDCGHRAEIFGYGGAAAEAPQMGAAFLGEIPLLPAIRESGDQGEPVALAKGTVAADAFREIAAQIAVKITAKPAAAKIRFED